MKKDPQGYGSASTYARRFGLQALVGLAAEADDDGNSHTTDPKAKTARDYTKKPEAKTPTPSKPASPDAGTVSKLVSAFEGLGVTVAMLEQRIGHPLGAMTTEDLVSLRDYHSKKKEMAAETPDVLAARLEAEKAEAGIAKEQAAARAVIDAQIAKMEGPAKPDAVARVKQFEAYVDRIRSSASVPAVVLLAAEIGQSKLPHSDLKILARQCEDRTFVLNDSAKQARRPKIQDSADVTQ